MDVGFWQRKWENNEIGFHQKSIHPVLAKEYARFSPGKILVPLCGKTSDMIFLSSKGHEVVGAELSPIACEAFFVENNLTYSKENFGSFEIYKSERITIWCGDYFELPQEYFENSIALYDRAALVALPVEVRKRYVEYTLKNTSHLKSLEILLCTFEYDSPELKGPPFSVVKGEVQFLFGEQFSIEEIISEKENDFITHDKKLGGLGVVEKVYWLKKI